MQKELPPGVIIGAIVVAVLLVGFFLWQGAKGGVKGDGQEGRTLAFPGGAGPGGVPGGRGPSAEAMQQANQDKAKVMGRR